MSIYGKCTENFLFIVSPGDFSGEIISEENVRIHAYWKKNGEMFTFFYESDIAPRVGEKISATVYERFKTDPNTETKLALVIREVVHKVVYEKTRMQNELVGIDLHCKLI